MGVNVGRFAALRGEGELVRLAGHGPENSVPTVLSYTITNHHQKGEKVHQKENDNYHKYNVSSGGLVTSLSGLSKATRFHWFGWPGHMV